jgi:transposase
MGHRSAPAYNRKYFDLSSKLFEVSVTYQNIFGVDTSKNEFVVALHGTKETKTFSNDFQGFTKFYETYRPFLKDGFVIIEATGGYERSFQSFLHDGNISSHKASGRQIKNFIRSFGVEAKTDAIDAKAIAQYGFERQTRLRLHKEKPGAKKALNSLVMRRIDLVQMLVAEKNRKQAPDNAIIRNGVSRHIAFIEAEIIAIEVEINGCISTNEELHQTVTAIKETDGIGEKTAPAFVALIPELGSLNRRQIASLCGVAPHPKQSGNWKGYAKTLGGRRHIRPMLYLSAMAVARSKGRLGTWYRELIARGKKPLVALVALMRKIIVIANAKARDARQKQISAISENHS